MKSLALPFALTPATFIDLLLTEVSALTFFGASAPAAAVIGLTVSIVVYAFALHLPLCNTAFIYLPISVEIDSFSVINVVLPASEVNIAFGLCVEAPARPQFFRVNLAEIGALVGVSDLD